MKKLMTMIASVAMAFGLFADATPSNAKATFETDQGYVAKTAISNLTEEAANTYYWLKGDDGAIGEVAEYDETSATGGDQYLAVDTASKPLYRAVTSHNSAAAALTDLTAVDIADGIFIDTDVKFTPSPSAPTLDEGVKLAVWVQEIEADPEADPAIEAATNLMVTASSTNFVLAVGDSFDFTAWHRLTIRSIKDVTAAGSKVSGFCIFIDGEQFAAADADYADKIGIEKSALTPAVAKFYDEQQLFLSCAASGTDANQQLRAVGVQGSGSIDNLAIYDKDNAKENCPFAIGSIVFNLAYDKTVVTNFDCAVDSKTVPAEAIVETDSGCAITLDNGALALVVSNIKVTSGSKVTNFDEGESFITFTGDLELGGEIKTETIVAKIGNKEYTSLKNAFDDAKATGELIQVLSKCELDEVLAFDANDKIVIDLNGQTITSNADILFDLKAGGWLEIYDSSEAAGAIATTATDGYLIDCTPGVGVVILGKASDVNDQQVTYDGIVFDNTVPYEDGMTDGYTRIFSGKFCYEGNTDEDAVPPVAFASYVADANSSCELDGTGDYWIVTPKDIPPAETFTVTVPALTEGLTITSIVTNNVPVANPVSGDYTLNEGELFTMTYAPDEGYKFTDDSEDGVRVAEETVTIVPPAVEEMAEAVAKIGDVEYTTVQAALEAAAGADTTKTVVLLKDVEESVSFEMAATRPVKFDLDGYTLTGDIAVTAPAGATAVFTVLSPATKPGTIVGDIEVTNGKITISKSTTQDVTVEGGIVLNDVADATIQGTIVNENGTAITLNGGLLKIANTAVIEADKAIAATAGEVRVTSNSSAGAAAEISGDIDVADGVTKAFKGGVYDSDISALVTDPDYKAVEIEGKWVIVKKDYVAEIVGGAKFETLDAAFTAAQADDEIVLLKDIELEAPIAVAKKVTLNIGDFDITPATPFGADAAGTKDTLFVVNYGGDFTVVGNEGVIDSSSQESIYSAIKLTEKNETSDGTLRAKLTVDANLTGYYYGITGHGSRGYTDLTVNGGVIGAVATDTNLGIYNPQKDSTVVINDGTITGLDSAIEMRGGTLTVNGGELVATATEYSVTPNGSGSTTKGAAVAVAQHNTQGDIAVTIAGGSLTGLNVVSVANPQGNETTNVEVALGKDATYDGALAFSADGNATVEKDPEAEILPPEGYRWNENGVLVKLVTATFISEGETVDTQVIDYGTAPTNVVVTKEGYTFTGWNPAISKITEDTTYTAQFEATTYTISYTFTGVEEGDMNKIVNNNPTTYTIESETITFADASCEGYTFKGWDIAKIDAGSTGNKTITGTFEKAEDPLPPWVPQGEKETYNTWKTTGPGATESDFTGTDAEIAAKMEDSFLLNCAPTEAALQTAKDNFKITSITKDASGNWVVLTVGQEDNTTYGNGLIKLKAFENVGCTGTPVTPADQSQLFWKASLVHPTANE